MITLLISRTKEKAPLLGVRVGLSPLDLRFLRATTFHHEDGKK